MKKWIPGAMIVLLCASAYGQQSDAESVQERNKELANAFYENLWNSNNTDRYINYLADTYIVHDIGDRKAASEPAVEQKNIADFFWTNGDMTFELDYQIAEQDLVATRWIWKYEPKTLFGRVILGSTDIPIINVFRFEDGKIVEIWNHRHDIDSGMTLRFTVKGFAYGVLFMLIPLLLLRARWRRKALAPQG